MTWVADRISAVMETLESRAAETVSICRLSAAARDLDLPYDVGRLARPGFADLARNARLRWAPAVELRSGAATFLPFDYVSVDWCVQDSWAPVIFSSTSNGLVVGGTVLGITLSEEVVMAPQDDGQDEQLDAMQGGSGTQSTDTGISQAMSANDPEQGEQ